MKVVVVGAGLTGAFSSFLLARAGAEVVCVDPGTREGRASDNNPGGLNPLHGPGIPGPLSQFALHCLDLHREHWQEIGSRSGIDFSPRFVERLMLAVDEEEMEALAALSTLYREAPGFGAELLDSGVLRQKQSGLAETVRGGLLTQGNAAVDSALYCRALLAAAQALGANVLATAVDGVRTEVGSVCGLETGVGLIQGDRYLFCTGPFPLPHISTLEQVQPVRGDLLLVSLDSDHWALDITWRNLGLYRAGQDRAWLGGSWRDVGFQFAPETAAGEAIIDQWLQVLPGLAGVRVLEHRCGLRPVCPDGFPVAGPLPSLDNAAVANGAGPKGVLYSAGMAELVCGWLCGQDGNEYSDLFKPDRPGMVGAG